MTYWYFGLVIFWLTDILTILLTLLIVWPTCLTDSLMVCLTDWWCDWLTDGVTDWYLLIYLILMIYWHLIMIYSILMILLILNDDLVGTYWWFGWWRLGPTDPVGRLRLPWIQRYAADVDSASSVLFCCHAHLYHGNCFHGHQSPLEDEGPT